MTDTIVRLVVRQDTEAEWDLYDPILASGEFGLGTDDRVLKLGDGVTPWTGLPAYVDPTAGGTAGADLYTFHAPSPIQTWTIPHNLNAHPYWVVLSDDGDTQRDDPDMFYPDPNTTIIVWSVPTSGYAYAR